MEKGIDHDRDGHKDFDFLFGQWTVRNRRLTRRFAGSGEWQEFDATAEIVPILNGIGNFDQFRAVMPDGKPLEGTTLRIFDPETRLWSLYWADSRSCRLFPPVVGRFRNGSGEFYGEDIEGDAPVKVRFTWTILTPDRVRWEQAMSNDGGQSWEHNWEMDMTRRQAAARRRGGKE
jgi:hypothetical protein